MDDSAQWLCDNFLDRVVFPQVIRTKTTELLFFCGDFLYFKCEVSIYLRTWLILDRLALISMVSSVAGTCVGVYIYSTYLHAGYCPPPPEPTFAFCFLETLSRGN